MSCILDQVTVAYSLHLSTTYIIKIHHHAFIFATILPDSRLLRLGGCKVSFRVVADNAMIGNHGQPRLKFTYPTSHRFIYNTASGKCNWNENSKIA